MMGRLSHDQEQFFYSFHLDEAVPDDHPVREIAAVLDLSWVHSELAPYYSQLGRPSIDPLLMIRMLIVNKPALSRSGASTEPRYSPRPRMMMTRQLRRLAGFLGWYAGTPAR
jgi:hypothetical protein